jgi:hypothetical protein
MASDLTKIFSYTNVERICIMVIISVLCLEVEASNYEKQNCTVNLRRLSHIESNINWHLQVKNILILSLKLFKELFS